MTAVLIALTGSMTLLLAVMTDTHFYRPSTEPWSTLMHEPVLAPYNALRYNINATNLAEHGLHPRYLHLVANLPLLMAPALPLLFRPIPSMRLLSAISGLLALSALPHQEPRFLLPLIPLLLSSVHLPINDRLRKAFIAVWIIFNVVMGTLMGVFHQGGVVPVQLKLGSMTSGVAEFSPLLPPGSKALWWKTYSPPVWLANANSSALETIDLMGMPAPETWQRLQTEIGTCGQQRKRGNSEVVLVAPRSRGEVEEWVELGGTTVLATERNRAPNADALKKWPGAADLSWSLVGEERRHVGLDDLDFEEDGVWGTLAKLVRSSGLQIWRVRRRC
jgi:GPI mannosyltransferase 4